ncbi:MAG TPA: type II toxin-antitoxin system VapC family toxin [Pirellulales bacterium]|jgi:PIN domain nuclease of toxin-antitoxin system|nr:type II toxin-antitoxin system VapC family toxin [Pirellulales bacterium]
MLLDSHALIWAVDDPLKLGRQADAALRDPGNEVLVSAGTAWELSIKIGLGKLTLSLPFRQWMARAMTDLGASLLPITVEHADEQSRLPKHHGDPFDRLLIAQALVEGFMVVSSDAVFDQYNVPRVW